MEKYGTAREIGYASNKFVGVKLVIKLGRIAF